MPEPEKTFKVDYQPPVLRTLTILGSEFNNECNQYTDVKENNFRKYKQKENKQYKTNTYKYSLITHIQLL